MSQKILHLSPLEEENNSEEDDDKKEKREKSNFIKQNTLPADNLNSVQDENNINRSKTIIQPKKSRQFSKLLSQRTINRINASKVDLCLYALDHPKTKRDQEMINDIKTYLKSMPSFMNIISKEKNNNLMENLVEQISMHLRHEFIPKNNIICRYGEKGEKFYIILKGKVEFMVPKIIKCFLNFEEYILYLMELRKNDEFEILNDLLVLNRSIYPINEDNFDDYIIREYDEYQKFLRRTFRKKTKSVTGRSNYSFNKNNNDINSNEDESGRANIKRITLSKNQILKLENNLQKKINFSISTYQIMEILLEKIQQEKIKVNLSQNLINEENNINKNLTGKNSPKEYLKSNNVINRELDPTGRKLINVYLYEEMNTFENGQTFGFIALQNKINKRASTAITIEDTDLGVLSKEEYIEFFEILSTKEKRILFDLLRIYNIMTSVSEHKFIKSFYHMFEFRKFYKNQKILDFGKPCDELLIFSQGLFYIYITVNIPELNELITKIKITKGKLLGLSKYKIEKTLEEKRENHDLLIRQNYMSDKERKILLKKYTFTISIISDHLILGYADTVNPGNHISFFNCICTSAECEGYGIKNKSIKIINQDSVVMNNLKDFCLMKIDYNLKRLKQFKKEILSKIKQNEISDLKDNIKNNNNENNNENINENDDEINNEINYVKRNELDSYKNINNNKKRLITNSLNHEIIENTIHIINNKNEDMKNTIDRGFRKSYNYNLKNKLTIQTESTIESKNDKDSTIKKLRDSIIKKQKRIELTMKNSINSVIDNKTFFNNAMIKKSLSSESLNKKENEENTKRNSNSIKKIKFNDINIFRKIVKDIKDINNKMLSSILAKNNKVYQLPNIKDRNKKEKIFCTENTNKPIIYKINSENKKYEKNKNAESYKIENLSFVKEKFIVFKSSRKMKKAMFNTVNYEILPKIRNNNEIGSLKMKKHFFNNLTNTNFNSTKKDIITEDTKINYSKTLVPKHYSKQKIINEKYNELNQLVSNIQNITKDILSKK